MEIGDEIRFKVKKVQELRYGENWHQKAGLYLVDGAKPEFEQLGGREISYNNVLDMWSAMGIVGEFEKPFCAIFKHTNPCGAACGEGLVDAYGKAVATDPVSSFGGIVGFNGKVGLDAVKEMVKTFTEVVVAPEFDDDAVAFLKKEKKNLRIIRKLAPEGGGLEMRKVGNYVLVQDSDRPYGIEMKVVTKKAPSAGERQDLEFAWKIDKYVKSNSIVTAKDLETVGIGPGQQSRNYSVKICSDKVFKDVPDPVLASDSFFPFRDGIDEAAKIGVTSIIQPGGSVRDQEVIDACDEYGMSMVFCGMRSFRH